MSGSVNKVILIGNVGKDPELRSTQSGQRIANFSLATSESWTDKQSGDKRERTEWHNIVVFNDGLVGVVEQYVKKGTKLYIEGAVQTRKWHDREGSDRYSTEIVLQQFRGQLVLLGDKPDRQEPQSTYADRRTAEPRHSATADLDDEIPF
jgi:single-strand DNA-binding protein